MSWITRGQQGKSARDTARDLIDENATISEPSRNTRKDCIRDVLEPYLFGFLIDDDYTRFDSNQNFEEVNDPMNNGQTINVHRRIRLELNKRRQHSLFTESEYYTNFQREYPGATVGYSVWERVLRKVGTFVTNPKQQSCVDEKTSALEHMMVALLRVMKRKNVKEFLQLQDLKDGALTYDTLLDHLRKAGSYQMISAICCPKEEEPDQHIIKSKPCPKFTPLRCTHSEDGLHDKQGNPKKPCPRCGREKRLQLLDALLSLVSPLAMILSRCLCGRREKGKEDRSNRSCNLKK